MGNKNSRRKESEVMLRVTLPYRNAAGQLPAVPREPTVRNAARRNPYRFTWKENATGFILDTKENRGYKYVRQLFSILNDFAKIITLSREEVALLTADDAEDYWYRNLRESTERIRELGFRKLKSGDKNFYNLFDRQIIVDPKHTPRPEMLVAIAEFNGFMCNLRDLCALHKEEPPAYSSTEEVDLKSF